MLFHVYFRLKAAIFGLRLTPTLQSIHNSVVNHDLKYVSDTVCSR